MKHLPDVQPVACHCGKDATHSVSNGTVTLRTCYLHARRAAQTLREAIER